MWIFEWIVASVTVVAGFFFALFYLTRVNEGESAETASPAKRKNTYLEMQGESANLQSYETAQILLAASIDLYDRKHAAFVSLDDKAQKLVGLIGGSASIFALFAGFTGYLHGFLTPLLVVSVFCFFFSLILLLLALRPVETDLPAITMFNSGPVLADPTSRAKIARRLIEAWQEMTLGLTPILRRKGRLIFVSSTLIVAGASLLLLNFLLLLSGAGAPGSSQVLKPCPRTTVLGTKPNPAPKCTETTK